MCIRGDTLAKMAVLRSGLAGEYGRPGLTASRALRSRAECGSRSIARHLTSFCKFENSESARFNRITAGRDKYVF